MSSPSMPGLSSSSSSRPARSSKMAFRKHPLLSATITSRSKPHSPTSGSSARSREGSSAHSPSPTTLSIDDDDAVSPPRPNFSAGTSSGAATTVAFSAMSAVDSVEDEDVEDYDRFDDGDVEDEEEDPDYVEADLRFPTFARRAAPSAPSPSTSTPSLTTAHRRRKGSPLRMPLTLDTLCSSTDSSPEDFCGERRMSLRTINAHSNSAILDDEELFSLDDGEELRSDEAHNQYRCQASIATAKLKATLDSTIDDDDDDETRAAFTRSLSQSSHSTRRASDRSSADLDMIWDEGEDDERALTDGTSISRRSSSSGRSQSMARSGSNSSGCEAIKLTLGNTAALNVGRQSSQTASSRSHMRIAQAGRSPMTPSSSSSYVPPTLLFARRPSESYASPSSAFASRRFSFGTRAGPPPPPLPSVRRSGSVKQQTNTSKQAVPTAVPSPLVSSTLVNGRRLPLPISTPVTPEVGATADAAVPSLAVHTAPLKYSFLNVGTAAAAALSPSQLSSGSSQSIASASTMKRATFGRTTTHILPGRKRSSTDPSVWQRPTSEVIRPSKSGSASPRSPSASLASFGGETRTHTRAVFSSVVLPIDPASKHTVPDPANAAGGEPDYYLLMFGLGDSAAIAAKDRQGKTTTRTARLV